MHWQSVVLATATAGVFGGFTNPILKQGLQGKVGFAVTENCIVWYYKQFKKPQRKHPVVEQLSFHQINRDPAQNPCPTDYSDGLTGARAAFAQTQSFLSLSLTFYQFALVGDRNDDGEYDATELRDVFESVGVSFVEHEGAFQYLAKLTGMFDAARQTAEFSVLTHALQALFQKGYRLTAADQSALNQVTGQS